MYVRGAKERDEVWLLEGLERMDLDDPTFRTQEYVIALDEENGEKAGFGRLRVHDDVCELDDIGVAGPWRGQGVGAHVVERLIDHAGDRGFDTVYALVSEPDYLLQFGFEPAERSSLPDPLPERLDAKRENREGEVIALALALAEFSMPERLRERFKAATPVAGEREEETIPAEEFGIDPDTATYKYDTTGRQ